jgi:hypothetical protein
MPIHDELESQAAPGGPVPERRESPAPDVSRAVSDPGIASHGALLDLQRLAGNASVSRMLAPAEEEQAESPVLGVVGKGGGQPLDATLRREMEGRLGADFSDVRLHTDAAATESARAVQANAYTVGNDVVFRQDRWAPDSPAGKQTLAHELTHVVQQRAGPVAGTAAGDGIRLSDPSDEFEQAAERTASAVMAADAPVSSPVPAAAGVQRQEEPEEEEMLQGEFVQRQEEPEEEEELQGA